MTARDAYVWTGTAWEPIASGGASAYDIALGQGFIGTEAQWLASIEGTSAYEAAVAEGFVGTEAEWVASLEGASAYEIAVANGFVGTEAAWLESLQGTASTLGSLTDVTVPTPADGNALVWDDTLGQWVAGDAAGGGASVAYQPTPPVAPEIGDVWVDEDGVITETVEAAGGYLYLFQNYV